MLYEMPPMLSGGEKQQIKDLRDYLVRLVHKLNESQGSAIETYDKSLLLFQTI